MPKKSNPPKVHTIPMRDKPAKRRAPKEVPDCNRPLKDGGSPGGLPPQGFKPVWRMVHGTGTKFHTHS